jgi:phosphopantothenoylcysteine decarboxylase / phosphopantothenate---cysteine ligase
MSNSNSKTKTIVVAVTGGIAAYKACEVVRLIRKKGHDVHVMMTEHAEQFVTSLTFQTLSGNPVATNMFELMQESQIGHIKLADEAALILVCPATANIIAKAATGICDDFVTTVLLATKASIVYAPSMNVNMWDNPITQKNVSVLANRGHHFIDPGEGELACGYTGKGRLAEPEEIVSKVLEIL